MNEFRDPWIECPSCHQDYQNELGIDIATEFVSFVQRQYPDDTQRQVESLYVKLIALESNQREVGDTANVLLSLIDRIKGEVSQLPMRYSQFEAFAFHVHGRIALDEGTEEGARRAVVHIENALEVLEAIGNADGIAVAKKNLALANSKYEGGMNNSEEVLKANQELYEIRISTYGEESEYTIQAGKDYAIALWQANRGEEAMELMTKLLATSKQVLVLITIPPRRLNLLGGDVGWLAS
jgi:hypothetical protein